MFVRLGNHAAKHAPYRGGDDHDVMSSAGGPLTAGEALDGKRVTYVPIEDDAKLSDTFADITKRAGIWHAHSQTSLDAEGNVLCEPPAWVESDVPGLAELLAAEYGCAIGAPDDLEETYHTDAGPPGIGPDGAIDGSLPVEIAHEQWENDVIGMHEYSAENASLSEAERAHHATQAKLRRSALGTTLMLMLAIAFYALSRVMLRVDAGKDFQSKVMGDTASNGTGTYASATYIALTENTSAPAAGDTTLTGELSGSGLGRAQATYAHTAGAASYTETKTFTSSDATTRMIHKAGLLNASSTGTLVFETALASDAILVSGDTLTITWTISI